MEINLGDHVFFIDEFGKEQRGRVISTNAYEQEGMIGIDSGSYGVYVRKPEEVRLVQTREVQE